MAQASSMSWPGADPAASGGESEQVMMNLPEVELLAATDVPGGRPEPDIEAAKRPSVTKAIVGFAERLLQRVSTEPPVWFESVSGGLEVSRRPVDVDAVLRLVETRVACSGVNTRSSRYLGFLPSGGVYAGALGDFLAAVVNPYAGLSSISPGAVELEAAVVEWLCRVVGLPSGASGTLTSGGSMATLTAVIAAREHHHVLPSRAVRSPVYVGEHRHHSVDRALRFAGLAECPLRVVPSAHGYRMDAGELVRLMAADAVAGLTPWLVVATAGTTSSGSIDPLDDVVAAARRWGAWCHVDAAYGGLFALTQRAQPRLSGMADADSVVVDPHKSLFLPYGTGALLVRDGAALRAAFADTADYLSVPTTSAGSSTSAGSLPREPVRDSPADLGMELTRPFRALRVWLPLQLAGSDAFAAALSEKLELASEVHAVLGGHPHVEIGPVPDLAVVTYRGVPARGDADAFNVELARRLHRGGEVFVSTTVLDGQVTLRVAIGSFRTHASDVGVAVEAVLRAIEEMVSQ